MSQRVVIEITADASQAQKVVDALNKSLGNIGKVAFQQPIDAVNKISTSLKQAISLSDQLVRTGYRLSLGLSAPIIAAGIAVAKLGADVQAARASFEVLSGSIDIANQHLNDLEKFSKTAPFRFTELLQLSSRLQAAGIAANDVIPLLKSVGNALVATGSTEGVERIVQQLVRIQNLGRVTLRELNPLARAGIPVFQELAQAIAKPGEAADETRRRLTLLLRSGSLSAPEFLRFFQAAQAVRFPSGLEKYAEQLRGQFTELLSSIEISLSKIGEALGPAFIITINVLKNLADTLGSFADKLASFSTPVRVTIGLFLEFLAILGPTTLALGYFNRSIQSVASFFESLTNRIDKGILSKRADTIATTESASASSAAASAKTKEAIATETLVNAVKQEAAARVVANASADVAAGAKYIRATTLPGGKGRVTKEIFPINEDAAASAAAVETQAKASRAAATEATASAALASTIQAKAATEAANQAKAAAAAQTVAETRSASAALAQARATAAISAAQKAAVSEKANTDTKAAAATLAQIKATTAATTAAEAEALATKLSSDAKVSAATASTLLEDSLLKETLAKEANVKATLDEARASAAQQAANIHAARTAALATGGAAVAGVATNVAGTVAAEATATEAVASNVTKAAISGAGFWLTLRGIVAGTAAWLSGIGEVATVAIGIVLALTTIYELAKGVYDYFKKTSETKPLGADAVDKAKQEYDAAVKAQNEKIKANELEQDRAKYIGESLRADKSFSESALDAQAKELTGIQRINLELQKAIEQRTRFTFTPKGDTVPQEGHFALSLSAQLSAVREFFANVTSEQIKTQREIRDEAFRADDEIFKNRISQLEAYGKAREAQIETNVSAEKLSELSGLRATADLQTQLSNERRDLELANADVVRDRQIAAIEEQKKFINTGPNGLQQALSQQGQQLAQSIAPGASIRDATTRAQIIKDYVAAQEKALNDLGAKEVTIARVTADEKKNIEIEAEYFAYEQGLKIIDAENKAYKEFQDNRIAAAHNAVLTILNFEKEIATQQRDIRLQTLEFTQPVSIKQALDIENQKLEIQKIGEKAVTDFTIQEIQQRGAEEFRAAQSDLTRRFGGTIEFEQKISDAKKAINDKTNEEVAEAYSKYNYEIGTLTRQTALNQANIVRQNAESIFDSIKKGSDTLLDQLFSKSKNISQVIANALKGAFLGTFKDIVSSQIAKDFTELRTGQKVTFFQSTANPFGSFLNRLTGKPIINANVAPPNTLVGQSPEQAAAQAVLEKAGYTVQVGTEPAFRAAGLPPARPVFSGVSTIDFLKDKFGDFSVLPDHSVPVTVVNLERLVANAPAGRAQLPEGADEESMLLFQQLRNLSSPLPATLNTAIKQAIKDIQTRPKAAIIAAPLLTPSGIIDKLTHTGPTVIQVAPAVPTQPPQQFPTSISPQLPDILKYFQGPTGTYQPTVKEQIPDTLTEISNKLGQLVSSPIATSRFSHSPIYQVKEPAGYKGEYNEQSDKILISDINDVSTRLHEEAHAVLAKSNQNIDALTALLPVGATQTANSVLATRFTAYSDSLTRAKEIIPRLLSGQGGTLGLTPSQSGTAVQSVITGLQNTGQTDLANTLQQMYSVGKTLPYGNVLTPGINTNEPLSVASGGILHDQAPISTFSAGGIIGGAAAGTAAAIAIFTSADRVKQRVKQIYGIEMDTRYAQHLADEINQKYKGNLTFGLRQPDIRQEIQLYALSTKQKIGAKGNHLPIGTRIEDTLKQVGLPISGAGLAAFSQYYQSTPTALTNQLVASGFTGQVAGGVPSTSLYDQAPIETQAPLPNLTQSSVFQNILPPTTFTSNAFSDTGLLSSVTPAAVQFATQLSTTGLINQQTSIQSEVPVIPIPNALGLGVTEKGTLAQITRQTSTSGVMGTEIPSSSGSGGITNTALKTVSGLFTGANISKTAYGLAGTLGLGLLSAGLNVKSGTGGAAATENILGAGLLTAAAAHAGAFGGLAAAGLAPLGVGLSIGAGLGLAAYGLKRGGAVGAGLTTAGGALAGAGIGTFILPGVGTAIGAAVGAAAGAAAGLFRYFDPTEAQKIQNQAKSKYGVNVSLQFARQAIQPIIDQQYAGNVAVGISSQQVRQLIELYGLSTGQQGAKNLTAQAQPSIFANQGGKLTQLPTYFNGLPVTPGATALNPNIPYLTPQGNYISGAPLPAGTIVGGSNGVVPILGAGVTNTAVPITPATNALSLTLALDGPTTERVLQGQAANVIQTQPRLISSANVDGQSQGNNRRENSAQGFNPTYLVS